MSLKTTKDFGLCEVCFSTLKYHNFGSRHSRKLRQIANERKLYFPAYENENDSLCWDEKFCSFHNKCRDQFQKIGFIKLFQKVAGNLYFFSNISRAWLGTSSDKF